jgi:Flp pilus assembly protein TadG
MSTRNTLPEARRRRSRGQALAESALVLPILVLLLLVVFDFGRGIYTYNGLSEAAREIARSAIVDNAPTLGAGAATQRTVSTQTGLVPGLRVVSFACLEYDGSVSTDSICGSGDLVRVVVAATYDPVSPLGLGGPIALSSSSSLQVP